MIKLYKITISSALIHSNYIVIDFLFDRIHVLLHGQYTTNELCNGLVSYFLESLHNVCAISLRCLQHELHPSIPYDFHAIHDPTTYLHRMQISVVRTNLASETSIWGDTFCIHWLGQQLKLPICLWSLMQGNHIYILI